jgi:hypothetical protein
MQFIAVNIISFFVGDKSCKSAIQHLSSLRWTKTAEDGWGVSFSIRKIIDFLSSLFSLYFLQTAMPKLDTYTNV